MKVDFEDTKENWRLWGQMVELWIHSLREKPENTGMLVNQMTAHGITGASVYGPPTREVKFYAYGDDGPLVFLLPTKEMLQKGRAKVHASKHYPLPVFYDDAFCGSRKELACDDKEVFASCRVGEYTINNCA